MQCQMKIYIKEALQFNHHNLGTQELKNYLNLKLLVKIKCKMFAKIIHKRKVPHLNRYRVTLK